MRIADKMSLQQVQSSLSRNRGELNHLQEQSSTQRRINKPSDDPLAATRVLGAKTEERNYKQFIKSLQFAKDFLNFTEQSLSEVGEILTRVKELALSQSNEASANESTRKVVSGEIEQLLMQTVQVANRKLGDRFIFGGYRTNQIPFSSTGDYLGDDGEIKVQINKEAFIGMNLPGNKVFLGENLGANDSMEVPRDLQQLQEYQVNDQLKQEEKAQAIPLAQVYASQSSGRGISSVPSYNVSTQSLDSGQGANIFSILQQLTTSLKTDNKLGIQESLDQIDLAFEQITNARSQAGARVMALNNTLDSLQKGIVDIKVTASQLEDADVFQLVSDINKAETALKATLETSGRLIQPSLLDFLK